MILHPKFISLKVQAMSNDKKTGLIVPYVDGYNVTEALNTVTDNWKDSYRLIRTEKRKDREGKERSFEIVEGIIEVDGNCRSNVGEGEGLKNAYTDAFKRAATKFGIGIELGLIQKNWAPVVQKGRAFVLEDDVEKEYKKKFVFPVIERVLNLELARIIIGTSGIKEKIREWFGILGFKAEFVKDLTLDQKFEFQSILYTSLKQESRTQRKIESQSKSYGWREQEEQNQSKKAAV